MSIDATADQALCVGSMFSLGWLMAELFGPVQHRLGSDTSAHQPTLSELDADSYVDLTLLELEKLLAPWPVLSDADLKAAWAAADHEGFAAGLQAGWATAHAQVVAALHTQASGWHALLAGETDLSSQTSVDAWVHAGQSTLIRIEHGCPAAARAQPAGRAADLGPGRG